MRKEVSLKIISLIFAVLVVCLAISFYAFAVWQEPTMPQPGGNVPPPLNTSMNYQIKTGALRLGGLSVDNDAWLAVSAGNVGIGTIDPSQKLDVDGYVKGRTGLCIGDDCRTTWPSGGGFIDRGDPSNVDYNLNDLIIDNAWHDLDLAADTPVPKTAKAVLLRVRVNSSPGGRSFILRENGNTNYVNSAYAETQIGNITIFYDLVVSCNNGVIEYRADNATWNNITIVVRGWWY